MLFRVRCGKEMALLICEKCSRDICTKGQDTRRAGGICSFVPNFDDYSGEVVVIAVVDIRLDYGDSTLIMATGEVQTNLESCNQ
jgi:hypothetical protein